MDVNYTVRGGLWEFAAQAKIDLVRPVWECKHMTKRVMGNGIGSSLECTQ